MRAITLCFIMFFFNACQAAPAAEAQAEPKVVASAEAACDCNDPIAKTKPGCDCAVKADNAALKTQQTANAVAAAQGASTPQASSCGGCGEGAKAAGSCGGCGEGAKAAGSCGGCGEGAKAAGSCGGCGAAAAGGAAPSCAGDLAPVEAQSVVAAPQIKGLEGRVFGAGVTLADSVAVDELLANADTYVGKNVRVEGVVSGVCPKRGCWISIAGEKPGSSLRFKVRDGVMVFPVEDAGKYAVAQGVVRKIPLSLERSKAWARHQRDSYKVDIDPDAITEPLTLVRLDGTGAVIRDKK